jgi:hypothetical protein
MRDSPIAFVLDCYSVDHSARTKTGRELPYIPCSAATDKFHALDPTVFAVLKPHAKKRFHDPNLAMIGTPSTKQEAVDGLIGPRLSHRQ